MVMRTGLVLSTVVMWGCSGGLGGGGGAHGASGDASSMVGVHAPAFSKPAVISGGTLSSESAKGKVLIVDFWATYCKPCEKEFPKLQALVDRHAGSLVVYALSEDETKEGISAFVRKTGAKFPIGWDDGNAISQRYKLEKMPTSYIVDRKGIIRFVHGGYGDKDADEIAREVDELLR